MPPPRSGPGWRRPRSRSRWDGEVRDLAAPLADGEEISIVTDRSPEALDLVRHDAAHVMATAVCELWPGTKVSIGPPIKDGFYYDFEFPEGVKVTEADFPAIEAKMAEHIAADEHFERTDIPVAEALERFKARGAAVQGRADRGPRHATRASRPSRCTATAPSPTSAAARTCPRPGGSRRSS